MRTKMKSSEKVQYEIFTVNCVNDLTYWCCRLINHWNFVVWNHHHSTNQKMLGLCFCGWNRFRLCFAIWNKLIHHVKRILRNVMPYQTAQKYVALFCVANRKIVYFRLVLFTHLQLKLINLSWKPFNLLVRGNTITQLVKRISLL